ncbi:MAG: FlgD immunoglobulin-like domain containing protein [Candidatus Latescibacteria bacterium]|nr:FlgD immunoglobulin-like domain containing protein [Candidatus Latescibacterota bacterium]
MNNRLQRTTSGLLFCLIFVLPSLAAGQVVPVPFHWSAPTQGTEAVSYNVWVSRNGDAPRIEATARDTAWTLEASVGVEYRVFVQGVDALERDGAMSPPSDVVYLPELQPEQDGPPSFAGLRPNYPNPFNPETTIRYGVPAGAQDQRIALELYDIRGQRVRSFQPAETPGWHTMVWNGRDDSGTLLSSGHYIVRLVCGGRESTWKMTMLK